MLLMASCSLTLSTRNGDQPNLDLIVRTLLSHSLSLKLNCPVSMMRQYMRVLIGIVSLTLTLYTYNLLSLLSRDSFEFASRSFGFQEGADDLEILNSSTIAQDDPSLVSIVRRMLIPPSQKPYNFTKSKLNNPQLNIDPSAGQSQAVKDILIGFGRDGFYVDCGANDGEKNTNTLWVERTLGWNGILIEADPRPFNKLMTKNRKAYVGNFCLSNTPHPQIVPFYLDEKTHALGSGLIPSKYYHATSPVQVQCFPLYTVLLALGRTTVDWFSLDVEGSEIDVLRTLPKDAIFKFITIEHNVLKEGKLGLRDFMTQQGYALYGTVEDAKFESGDSIFIHNSVVPTLTDEQRAFGFDKQKYSRPSRY